MDNQKTLPAISDRKLAAVLFADIEGFTAIMQEDEVLGRNTLAKFRTNCKDIVPAYSGRIIQFYGDGCLCLFDSAVNALYASMKLQHNFQEEPKIPVRMGLHMGDIHEEADHVYGDSINIASRIESMSIPGSILFSQSIQTNIRNHTEFEAESLGTINFKNISEPIAIYGLVNDGLNVPNQAVSNAAAGLRILVIEDEILAANRLIGMVKKINPNHVILETIDSVEESINWLDSNRPPHLILSDIQLSDGLSLRIFSERKVACPVIFTTAFEKYAIQAFEVNGVDYLLKPIKEDRLREALDRCSETIPENTSSTEKLLEEFKSMMQGTTKNYKSRFLCKLGNKIKSVPVNSVLYFYSKNKITFLVTDEGNRFPTNHTLDEIEDLVDPQNYFRVNRQFVIHFDSIDEIQPYFKGRLKLKLQPDPAEDITVSSEKSPVFKAWLDR